jgi:hypothetical protein
MTDDLKLCLSLKKLMNNVKLESQDRLLTRERERDLAAASHYTNQKNLNTSYVSLSLVMCAFFWKKKLQKTIFANCLQRE